MPAQYSHLEFPDTTQWGCSPYLVHIWREKICSEVVRTGEGEVCEFQSRWLQETCYRYGVREFKLVHRGWTTYMLKPTGAGTMTGMAPGLSPNLWGAAKAAMAMVRRVAAYAKKLNMIWETFPPLKHICLYTKFVSYKLDTRVCIVVFKTKLFRVWLMALDYRSTATEDSIIWKLSEEDSIERRL